MSPTVRYVIVALGTEALERVCSAANRVGTAVLAAAGVIGSLRMFWALSRIKPGALFHFVRDESFCDVVTVPSPGSSTSRVMWRKMSPGDVLLAVSGIRHVGGCSRSRTSCIMMGCRFTARDKTGAEIDIRCDRLASIRFIGHAG